MRKSDLSALHFLNGGVFSSPGPWIHGRRVIDSTELIVVTRGEACLYEGEMRFTLRAGDFMLLHPGVEHGGWRESEGAVEFFWLHFIGWEAPAGCSGHLSNPGILVQSARQLLQISACPAYPEGTAEHMLAVILAELEVQRDAMAPKNALAVQLHEFIRSHSDRPLTVRQVASAFGYHPDYLSRILKECYGRSLQQDIAAERMNRARFLLQTTRQAVSAIALELGYEDANLFEKFFRYHQKCTPTAYRNSFPDNHTNHR